MATVNQIYGVVNSIASQALGKNAISATDTSGLVSLGDIVLSSTENKEKFYNTLVDRIGATWLSIREYNGGRRSIYRKGMDFGIVLQKISFTMSNATNDYAWNYDIDGSASNAQKSPFDVDSHIVATQKLFSKVGVWSFEEKIPDIQLKRAFTNAQAMGAFISGLYMTIGNAMELALENMGNLAIARAITDCGRSATKATNPTTNICRNLLYEYNRVVLGLAKPTSSSGTITYPTGWLMASDCLTDKDFLKYVSKELALTVKHMGTFSTIFNVEGHERFTPRDKCVVEVLNHLATSANYYLESDTYHNDLVSLPSYEDVSFWQGTGADFSFANCSKVSISNGAESNDIATMEGVIAFIHDNESVVASMYDRRSHSIYNPRSEVVNYFVKANVGYAIDPSENAVVFTVNDPTASGSTVTEYPNGKVELSTTSA